MPIFDTTITSEDESGINFSEFVMLICYGAVNCFNYHEDSGESDHYKLEYILRRYFHFNLEIENAFQYFKPFGIVSPDRDDQSSFYSDAVDSADELDNVGDLVESNNI